ncbi:MAG: RNA polymerase sporulation sigma factor SigK [Lachnospiraceae bacterium]|nr:RNA polymerase sporulation sigma factor SigK [Lachnospiraceae bacterium]MBR3762283.1 RNA polymerase sporulation sigma factor SigK [Lachnospiraceae bacterium]
MQTFLKPLSEKEEAHYLTLLKSEDREIAKHAKDELIMHNLRLVAHITKKYQNSPEDAEDYISIGIIGLMKAIDTFDAGRGRLATYACRCIDNELLMMLRAKKKSAKEVSLYEPVGTDKEGNEIQIYDLCTEKDDIISTLERQETMEALRKAMDSVLEERERDVIIRRYGLGGMKEQTQQEVGKVYGISRSYVSRIEKRALLKLRAVLER